MQIARLQIWTGDLHILRKGSYLLFHVSDILVLKDTFAVGGTMKDILFLHICRKAFSDLHLDKSAAVAYNKKGSAWRAFRREGNDG